MPVPTAAEKQRLRDSFAPWRQESCQIERPTRTTTSDGGYTDSYTTVATVPCVRTPDIIPPVERQAGTVVKSIMRWWVGFDAGIAVRVTDRLLISGRYYEVLAVQDRTIEIQRRVLAQELS